MDRNAVVVVVDDDDSPCVDAVVPVYNENVCLIAVAIIMVKVCLCFADLQSVGRDEFLQRKSENS